VDLLDMGNSIDSGTTLQQSNFLSTMEDISLVESLLKVALTSLPNEKCLLYENGVLKILATFECRSHKVLIKYI
jgi:hypothetical protein